LKTTPFDTLHTINWLTNVNSLVTPPHIKISILGINQTPPLSLVTPDQVHGSRILSTLEAEKGEKGDGVFTHQIDLAIGVRTADCLPILFYSSESHFIMAVHGGWKGFTAGIINAALETAKIQNVSLESLQVAIGPSIGREAFEVGPEVLSAFESHMETDAFFLSLSKGTKDRWHLDLQMAAALELIRMGIKPSSIQVLRICTKSSLEYHSRRREGPGFRHNYSIIKLGN
jgi:YfiH family protein